MFYKFDTELLSGEVVEGSGFSLNEDSRHEYELPIDGWHYFTSESEAKSFFGIVDTTS
jgi:hypothetical protein